MNVWEMMQLQSSQSAAFSLDAVFLFGLLLAMIWKPERIQHLGLFRFACTLFVLSMLVPLMVQLVVAMVMSELGGKMYNGRFTGSHIPETPPLMVVMRMAVGPLIRCTAMFCGFAALMPRKRDAGVAATVVAEKVPHPLD